MSNDSDSERDGSSARFSAILQNFEHNRSLAHGCRAASSVALNDEERSQSNRITSSHAFHDEVHRLTRSQSSRLTSSHSLNDMAHRSADSQSNRLVQQKLRSPVAPEMTRAWELAIVPRDASVSDGKNNDEIATRQLPIIGDMTAVSDMRDGAEDGPALKKTVRPCVWIRNPPPITGDLLFDPLNDDSWLDRGTVFIDTDSADEDSRRDHSTLYRAHALSVEEESSNENRSSNQRTLLRNDTLSGEDDSVSHDSPLDHGTRCLQSALSVDDDSLGKDNSSDQGTQVDDGARSVDDSLRRESRVDWQTLLHKDALSMEDDSVEHDSQFDHGTRYLKSARSVNDDSLNKDDSSDQGTQLHDGTRSVDDSLNQGSQVNQRTLLHENALSVEDVSVNHDSQLDHCTQNVENARLVNDDSLNMDDSSDQGPQLDNGARSVGDSLVQNSQQDRSTLLHDDAISGEDYSVNHDSQLDHGIQHVENALSDDDDSLNKDDSSDQGPQLDDGARLIDDSLNQGSQVDQRTLLHGNALSVEDDSVNHDSQLDHGTQNVENVRLANDDSLNVDDSSDQGPQLDDSAGVVDDSLVQNSQQDRSTLLRDDALLREDDSVNHDSQLDHGTQNVENARLVNDDSLNKHDSSDQGPQLDDGTQLVDDSLNQGSQEDQRTLLHENARSVENVSVNHDSQLDHGTRYLKSALSVNDNSLEKNDLSNQGTLFDEDTLSVKNGSLDKGVSLEPRAIVDHDTLLRDDVLLCQIAALYKGIPPYAPVLLDKKTILKKNAMLDTSGSLDTNSVLKKHSTKDIGLSLDKRKDRASVRVQNGRPDVVARRHITRGSTALVNERPFHAEKSAGAPQASSALGIEKKSSQGHELEVARRRRLRQQEWSGDVSGALRDFQIVAAGARIRAKVTKKQARKAPQKVHYGPHISSTVFQRTPIADLLVLNSESDVDDAEVQTLLATLVDAGVDSDDRSPTSQDDAAKKVSDPSSSISSPKWNQSFHTQTTLMAGQWATASTSSTTHARPSKQRDDMLLTSLGSEQLGRQGTVASVGPVSAPDDLSPMPSHESPPPRSISKLFQKTSLKLRNAMRLRNAAIHFAKNEPSLNSRPLASVVATPPSFVDASTNTCPRPEDPLPQSLVSPRRHWSPIPRAGKGNRNLPEAIDRIRRAELFDDPPARETAGQAGVFSRRRRRGESSLSTSSPASGSLSPTTVSPRGRGALPASASHSAKATSSTDASRIGERPVPTSCSLRENKPYQTNGREHVQRRCEVYMRSPLRSGKEGTLKQLRSDKKHAGCAKKNDAKTAAKVVRGCKTRATTAMPGCNMLATTLCTTAAHSDAPSNLPVPATDLPATATYNSALLRSAHGGSPSAQRILEMAHKAIGSHDTHLLQKPQLGPQRLKPAFTACIGDMVAARARDPVRTEQGKEKLNAIPYSDTFDKRSLSSCSEAPTLLSNVPQQKAITTGNIPSAVSDVTEQTPDTKRPGSSVGDNGKKICLTGLRPSLSRALVSPPIIPEMSVSFYTSSQSTGFSVSRKMGRDTSPDILIAAHKDLLAQRVTKKKSDFAAPTRRCQTGES